MRVIRRNCASLNELDYGDTFFPNPHDDNIYIKTYYADEDDDILCVNIETGQYCYLSTDSEVIPVECCVSVRA